MTADKNRQANGKFAKGNSAGGRTKGSRNKSTITALELMNGQLEKITQALINQALEGDLQAIKLVLERLVPICKETPLTGVSIPKIEKCEDLPKASQSIFDLLASGEIVPSQATALTNILTAHAKNIELFEIAERIKVLEARAEENN